MFRLTFFSLALVFACNDKPAPPTTSKERKPNPAQPRTDEPAVEAKDPFVEDAKLLTRGFEMKLKDELMRAMKEGGPANAVEVCSKRAEAIAQELSSDKLLVRRVGTRVRNPKNKPDEVDQRALGVLSEASPTYHVADPQRFYRAIFAKPLCLGCHGAEETLAPEVVPVLAKLYAGDKARGYAAGDLRGAFVVEARGSFSPR